MDEAMVLSKDEGFVQSRRTIKTHIRWKDIGRHIPTDSYLTEDQGSAQTVPHPHLSLSMVQWVPQVPWVLCALSFQIRSARPCFIGPS